MKLSILKNAKPGYITYYTGENYDDVKHLNDCTLICCKKFEELQSVEQIIVNDPQLYFYELSNKIENKYLFTGKNIHKGKNSDIHPSCIIGNNVHIGDNVSIGPNTVIYSKTTICEGTRIDANVTLGTAGMMWAWKKGKKIFLQQLGGLKIGNDCIIGSNCAIVRGSANELTIIENNVNMAPGCNIGHGTWIGNNSHLANNVTIGGSVSIAPRTFIGCGAVLNPGVTIVVENVIIGGGATVVKSIHEPGVYAGVPSKKLETQSKQKLSGVPIWSDI